MSTTVSETSANFNFSSYFSNDSMSYDDPYNPFQRYRDHLVDPTGAQLNFLVESDRPTHPQQFQGSFSTPIVGAGDTAIYEEQRFHNDSDNIVENADFSSETDSQNFYSQCSSNSVDGLLDIDNFSTTTEEAPLLSTLPSSPGTFSTALDGFATKMGELSDAFAGTLTIVEGLDAKVCSLHQKINGLSGMMDEIMKRERLAMEKFGDFADPVDRPKQLIPFHIEGQKTADSKRRSPN